ncbi:uncharacterized protein [Penaeus vannamei]|uniref:uncharacterized protein n=1 Tax=Penaeus vannamei TaxID=6689 RepID=UPI00387F3D9C
MKILDITPVEILDSTPVEILDSTPVEILDSTPVEILDSTPVEILDSTPVEILDITPVEILDSTPVEILDSTPVEILDGTPVEILDSTPVEILDSTPVEILDSTPVEILDSTPVEILDSTPVEILDSTPVEILDSTPVEILDSTPVEILDSTSVEILDSTPVEILDSTPVEILDSTPVEILDSTPVEILDSTPADILDSTLVEIQDSALAATHAHCTERGVPSRGNVSLAVDLFFYVGVTVNEFFALQNPTAKIWYVITAPYVDDTDSLVTILSERYKNLEVVGDDLDKMFTGTPLEKLFKSGKWTRNTPWPANNLSNLLRNVLLWRWGGLNADTDCICVRNVTHLRNTLSYDEKDRVANNAIMHFEARHRFVLATMEYLKRNFKVATWHVNGPGAASHIVQELCGTKDLSQLLSRKCDSVELMPLKNMQLYNWKEWENFFEKGKGRKFIEDHKDAYILHMYNKLSKKRAVEIGSQTIYDSVASVVCPLTYEAAKRRAYFF